MQRDPAVVWQFPDSMVKEGLSIVGADEIVGTGVGDGVSDGAGVGRAVGAGNVGNGVGSGVGQTVPENKMYTAPVPEPPSPSLYAPTTRSTAPSPSTSPTAALDEPNRSPSRV